MGLGIYISVPFCRTKCSYCNFASGVFARDTVKWYAERVCEDMAHSEQTITQAGGVPERAVDSIYLGGGTPSTLEASQLERIFEGVRRHFEVDRGAEITVECAPGTVSPEVIGTLARCGVNRVSLGVQSFVDREAAAVGRLHNRTIVLEDIARLRSAGMPNINIDLIAGLPHQDAASWRVSLEEAIATQVPHVSVYMLEVDEDSRLGRELIAGGTRYHAHFVPDDDLIADLYLEACAELNQAGIAQYEISNFARPGTESKHNLKYWTRQPYAGFGLDAHSMVYADPYLLVDRKHVEKDTPAAGVDAEAVRLATSDSLDQYLAGAPVEVTVVSKRAALEETFFLGLRLTRGVSLRDVADKFGLQAQAFSAVIEELEGEGLLEFAGDVVRLTTRGKLLSNEVFERFIGAGSGTAVGEPRP